MRELCLERIVLALTVEGVCFSTKPIYAQCGLLYPGTWTGTNFARYEICNLGLDFACCEEQFAQKMCVKILLMIKANNLSREVCDGVVELKESKNPFCPAGSLMQVRIEFRSRVASALGEMYALSALAIRNFEDGRPRYASVMSAPGNVLVFTSPAMELRDEWIEPLRNSADHRDQTSVLSLKL